MLECRRSDHKMVKYLIDKLERLNNGAVISCRYDITEELRKLRIDPNLKISEIIKLLQDMTV